MYTESGVFTSKSPNHEANEDAYRILDQESEEVIYAQRGQLFAAIDGIGGAAMGQRTAHHVAMGLRRFFTDKTLAPTWEGLAGWLRQLNDQAFAWGVNPDTEQPLAGAAATIIWFSPEREVFVFHAGDTACFHGNDRDYFRCVTRSHSHGHTLQRYFGQGPYFEMDIHRFPIEEDDIFCLVTDGVTKGLTQDAVRTVLCEEPSPQKAALKLVQRARGRGSKDDITALVIHFTEW